MFNFFKLPEKEYSVHYYLTEGFIEVKHIQLTKELGWYDVKSKVKLNVVSFEGECFLSLKDKPETLYKVPSEFIHTR